jgi:hypothetical protein
MSSEFWYLDQEHNRRGPVAQEQFVGLIRAGTIRAETQIWSSGMSEWRMAGQVEAFSSLFGPSGPSPLPVAGGASSALPTGPLSASLPVWGLFWRSLLVIIGGLLVVPAPWTSTSFYKWLCEQVSLPDGKGLKFAGKPGDIWYVFIAWGASIWLGQLKYGQLVTIPLAWIFAVLLLRWFCANVSTQDGRLKLSFEGGYLPYIGWNLLLVLSALTIIGWAWVMKLMMQWICRNVRGTAQFEFTATGLAILWRTLVLVLVSILVIPIPWMIRWYMRWMISQVSVASAGVGVPSK